MSQGFYKQNDENNYEWLYAPNKIYGPGYILCCSEKEEYEYPIDGWSWYEESPEGYLKFKEWSNSKAYMVDGIEYDTYFAAHDYFTSEEYLDDN